MASSVAEEKKRYILLMLLDTYSAHFGDVEERVFGAIEPEGDGVEAFYGEVQMMFGIEPPTGRESIARTVDRIFAEKHPDIVSAGEFLEGKS